jgi:hypothetical protein
MPRRWRKKVYEVKPSHRDGWLYGCYFPGTDLNVSDMGVRGTGVPSGVEWLDAPSELMEKILDPGRASG